ncbi:unnamed protein product [Penicillium olsonii]|nr:unnamed protein product [Penicillium olsonii]
MNEHSKAPNHSRPLLYIPNTLWTRLFASTVITETVLTVAIESWILISLWNNLSDDGKSQGPLRLQSFLGLFIFALLYELALSYDALRRKNTIQLVGLCICNLGLLTYSFLQMQEIQSTISGMVKSDSLSDDLLKIYRIELIIVPIILGVGTVCMIFFTWKLRAEFSWSIYKNISADLQMKRRYLTYQVYISLLKFDFFFVFGSQLQVLLVVTEAENADFILNAALIPITIATLILSAQFCKREMRKSLLLMMFFMLIIMGCFALTLVRMHSTQDSVNFKSVRISLSLFAGVSLLLMLFTLINSVMCIINFNKGLKIHVNPPKKRRKNSIALELQESETPTRCHRCHSQKIKCSGEKPCAKCRSAGYGHQCNYATRDRKIRVDESYLEQLLRDSEELHKQRHGSKQEPQLQQEPIAHDRAVVNDEPKIQGNLLGDKPWFQVHDAPVLPLYISEATCTAFATRLCQCLTKTNTPTLYLPKTRYTDEATLSALLHSDTPWPNLVSAQLMVKTALGHIIPCFHLALKRDSVDMLHGVYQRGDFDNPSIKCKYFALFALSQAVSTPRDASNQSHVPGSAYFARALSLIQIIPERPSMIHIESLLLIAYFCQFLNRFHSAYVYVGNALRLALGLGLNYNVPQDQDLHPIASEHRIRIWWTIYTLERFWGSKLGFPMQIHDEDVHVDEPSLAECKAYPDQFSDGAYQIAGIQLSRITGDTTGEIYCRKISTESFLHREQKLLTQLKQWVQSLPPHLRLNPEGASPKHTIHMHLQFNFCVILTIRPVLLHVLTLQMKNPNNQFAEPISPVLATLSEACIHSARHSLALCVNEWTVGSLSKYGYTFPAYLFSAALVLMLSSLLPLGDPSDLATAETAMEMLRSLSLSDQLISKDYYERIQRVHQCLHSSSFRPSSIAPRSSNVEGFNELSVDQDTTATPLQPCRPPARNPIAPAEDLSHLIFDSHVPYLTTEMALHQPTMLDFLTQSDVDFGLPDSHRALRLKALQTSPNSFSSTYEIESKFTETTWQDLITLPNRTIFICTATPLNTQDPDPEPQWIGQVTLRGPMTAQEFTLPPESGQAAQRPDDEEERWQMLSLFTLPEHRGLGLGAKLCQSAMEYLRVYRSSPRNVQVRLIVKAGNDVTIRFYERLGFVNAGMATLVEALVANGDEGLLPGDLSDAKWEVRGGLIMNTRLVR